ncbi:hypothetical protein [Neptunomonas antarctica]|uniref:Uncharacterized protein n=1 Tax=Neptunomonas antarctica TaxID=619304 RepID=A0A1N7L588_9GAMM|nr:hypothetical protein [Neptunomonas antarctica]SIS68936.1 hypothetical protein SAMN05421760_103240 [Neptunomonas antarctica]
MEFYKRSFCAFLSPLLVTFSGFIGAVDINNIPDSNEAVLLSDLEQVRGRGGIIDMTTIVNANADATLENNTAVNNINGFNIIDKGSFTEASGVFSIIQNTGNNVIIQDSTIITVTITP